MVPTRSRSLGLRTSISTPVASAYLSIKGTHKLLDGAGQLVGLIEGQFTMTRALIARPPAELTDAGWVD